MKMSEQKNESLLQEQKRTRPKIENLIPVYITGDNQKIVFDFVAWLRENKMSPGWAGFTNSWTANYKGKSICKITLCNNHEPSWSVTLPLRHVSKYEETIINERLQDIVWDNQQFCVHKDRSGRTDVHCNPNKECAGGVIRTIFGKEIDGVCRYSWFARFLDPDEATINGIKRLLELEQRTRAENAAKKSK